MNVEWREVKSNPDYIVSSDGQVGSRWYGKLRILKGNRDTGGYIQVVLCDGSGGRRTVFVHTLVAEAFLGPSPTPEHTVNHKNGIKTDNRATNFEWLTRTENVRHAYHVLGRTNPRGEAHYHAKFTETDVREMRRRCAAGETQTQVAKDYGIAQGHVNNIVTGKGWAWLE